MKYKVLDSLRAQTKHGEIELQPGQVITLPPEKAVKLIDKGKILPEDPHSRGQKTLSGTLDLRQAYRAIWSLPEEASIEAYESAWREIKHREREVPSEVALNVLREEAREFYDKTGRCPFCGGPELHLPAASPSEELWTKDNPLRVQEKEELHRTPLKDLKAPLKVWSDLLGETIYLVATEADAHLFLAEGEVAYCSQEVAKLLEIKRNLPEDIAKEWIQGIHQVKKQFGGMVKEVNWNDQRK